MTIKHYKDSNDNLFGYEDDGSQDYLIGDKVLLSDAEYAALQAQKSQEFLDSLPAEAKMAMEMPSQQDQMEALLTGGQAASDMLAKIQSIKAKYANA